MSRRRESYNAAADFVRENLPAGEGRSCLVVGSPIFEARELMDRGWDVTYVDVRQPPEGVFKKFVRTCVTMMDFHDESFDALSSTCVLSHVGMGRYGDPLVEHGDEKGLANMARVMKKGALGTIMFGNVAAMPAVVQLGKCHRIFTMTECRRMLAAAGLEELKVGLWSLAQGQWFKDEDDITTDFMGNPDYVTFLVRKC